MYCISVSVIQNNESYILSQRAKGELNITLCKVTGNYSRMCYLRGADFVEGDKKGCVEEAAERQVSIEGQRGKEQQNNLGKEGH